VTASVRWPPKELLLVVVTIKPAKANNETDKITNAISTSISENPLDFLKRLKVSPPGIDFELIGAKPVPIDFGFLGGKNRRIELFNRLKGLEAEIEHLENNLLSLCFLLLMKSLN